MAEKKQPKYLIQSETGDIYPFTNFLAARGDMFPYDEETLGPIGPDGKSISLSAAKDKSEEKTSSKKDK